MLSTLLGEGYFNHSIKWHTHGSLKRWEGLLRSRLMEVWSNRIACKSLWTIRRRERGATCLCLHSKNSSILSALKNNTSSALNPYHQQLLPYLKVYPANYTYKKTQTPPCVHCWTTCITAESQTASPKSINKTHYWDTVLHNITVEAWKIHLHFYLCPDAGWKKSNKNPDFHYTG